MKKRRMKLLALMLTAAVTITSVLPVGAAATDGSEVPQQVTELTDPLDEGSGATDNGLGVAEGEGQIGDSQTDDGQTDGETNQVSHEAEAAQDDHWTLDKTTNAEEIVLRYYEDAATKQGYQKKWVLNTSSGIWTYYEVDENGVETEEVPVPVDENQFVMHGKTLNLYETGVINDKEDGLIKLIYAFENTVDGLKGYGGYWLIYSSDGSYHYITEKSEVDLEGEWNPMLYDGLQIPTDEMEGLQILQDEYGKELACWLDDQGMPQTNTWKIHIDEQGKKIFYYFGEDGMQITAGTPSGLQNIEGTNYWMKEDGKPDVSSWHESDGKYLYFDVTGAQTVKTGRQEIDKSIFYWLNDDGSYVKSGWKADGSKYYYFGTDGKQDLSKTGLQTISGSKYYVNKDGTVLRNGSIVLNGVRYFFGSDGKSSKSYKIHPEGWQRNNNGWWYQKEDGSWPVNSWYEVKGQKYYFDGNGYMKTGWLKLGNSWYYLNGEGAMVTGWLKLNNTWYYLTPGTGVMKTGWYQVGGTWYYSNGNGDMQTGWLKLGNTWYYLTGSGAMATGWINLGGTWYYLTPGDGAMRVGWYQVGGIWYYSSGSGAMMTGWLKSGNTWYYLTGSGAMATGWINLGGTWYYLTPGNGAMVTGWINLNGTWYYLTGSGAMATGWLSVGNTWYYLTGSGAMATGWLNLGGTWYYLTPGSGAMKTGWYQVGGEWYYSYGSGAMASNSWIDTYYYVGGSGAMLRDTTIGGYYVDKNGRWVPGYGTVNVNTNGVWEQQGETYYFKKSNGTYAKGEYIAWNGNWYYLNDNGVMLTGWQYIKGYKMYFSGSGALQQDVSGMVGGPYRLRVNRTKCQITVLAKDGSNGWIIPVKSITCSVGNPITLTPAGTFYIGDQDRWHILMGPSWGQWTSHVVNGIFIHSVAGNPKSQYNLSASDYNMLGMPASHGCIRVCVRDAKWIYDNTGRGTMVTIGDNFYEPFDKPATIKLAPGMYLKDPTDIW